MYVYVRLLSNERIIMNLDEKLMEIIWTLHQNKLIGFPAQARQFEHSTCLGLLMCGCVPKDS